MKRLRSNPLVGVLVAGSLFISSTGAAAATSAVPSAQINPWGALAALSGGAPAAALCGAAVAAAAANTGARAARRADWRRIRHQPAIPGAWSARGRGAVVPGAARQREQQRQQCKRRLIAVWVLL